MAVHAEFYKHKDFGGSVETFDLNNSYRYWWIKFGSNLGNEVSSFRANAFYGFDGNVYALTKKNFLGDYLSLNMDENWTAWWSWVGSDLNDDVESALLINRNKDELEIEVADLIMDDFKSGMDDALEGKPVKRKGDPKIYSLFWPGHDPSRKFVSIEQDLRVELDWWSDYDAKVRYDVYLYLNSSGNIRGYVAWTYCWVEGGVFSGRIFDDLHPQLVAGASTLNTKIQEKLSLLSFFTYRGLYLLPGSQPSSSFGDIGNAKDNSTLVLVR